MLFPIKKSSIYTINWQGKHKHLSLDWLSKGKNGGKNGGCRNAVFCVLA